jgi:uncharacterized protein (TIGR00299 family) protein
MADLAQRIHLDPIGGIAGDMFVAALADAFPALIVDLLAEVKKLPAPAGAEIGFVEHRDGVLGGRRFQVAEPASPAAAHYDHHHDGGHTCERGAHAHAHTDYADIRRLLHEAPLRAPVRQHALRLFALLAEAEAEVHGIELDEVAFHEVGAWDSIVDFVAAAYMIDAVGAAQWTCAPVPLGGGRVRGTHGILPLPAPATALLLRDMQVIDDGIGGERVTPTGAAILKYLCARTPTPRDTTPLVMSATGNGFGTRTLPGISNVLRCVAFAQASGAAREEEISVASFEIDDQTAEDLALALDRVRQAPGVLEVFQAPVFGKKGRMLTQVQILARPEHIDAIAQLCFAETSTLGLRLARVSRKLLPRSMVSIDTPTVRVKLATRPSGQVSAKAEMDDLAVLPGGKAVRDQARRTAQHKATGGNKS